MEFHHIPVLFEETINSLEIDPDGIYVDCTAGGGGHSSAIASSLRNGRLISIDRDPEAIQVLTDRFSSNPNVTIVHNNFFNIKTILSSLGIDKVNGILADLGVSSHQLDDASRGFSFHSDAPLDMRMSLDGMSAADAVNNLSAAQLRDILYRYGDEKFAPSIANAIVKARQKKPIETTLELAEIISNAVPASARRDAHPARKSFQAIRIYVNGELDGLEQAVNDMFDCLLDGGRLSIITFHSLEDRAVKKSLQLLTQGCTCPKSFPVCVCGKTPAASLVRAVSPSLDEIGENPRSRSAKLRTAVKLHERRTDSD